MLTLQEVTLHRGERAVFDGLNLTIHGGHKAGIVGRNGVGKTTLFELIRRRLLPEEGTVMLPEAWRIACLEQTVQPSPRPALDFVLDGDERLRRVEGAIEEAERNDDGEALGRLYSEYQDAGGYDAHARGGEILSGLGFGKGDFDKPHQAFSGGWRIRLNLARALMTPSDLLLLDEPTNHLDLEATLWLENWLRKYQGTLAMIAHDREFLDKTVQEIVHVQNGRAAVYVGNYAAFERQRAEALERQAALHKHQQLRVAEIRRFVDRFRAKDSKAKQVQSRLKALQKMELVAPVHAESPYRFAFTGPRKISNPTLQLDRASLGYDDTVVLADVTLRVYPNDRIGVLGANGAGKTTLLRCLAGELAPLAGSLQRGRHSAAGYFAQHQLESLDLRKSPLQHIEEVGDGVPSGFDGQKALDYLGGWGFRGDDVRRPAHTFSGGEKARLVLSILACQQPALLILDEPSNHLDLEMREALAIALQEYHGALLLVAHDRYLLERCVDSFWLVADGQVAPFADDLTAYAALKQGRTRAKAPTNRQSSRSSAKALAHRQRSLEARIDAQAQRIDALERRLHDASINNRSEQLAELAREHRQAAREVERCEQAWLAAQEEIDRLTASV